ncbi:MAG: biotin/lipoyl-binding protein, partial [Anaerolineae bacterium]|nr:biotin/lipoyl-binding protein [Anaerolineae bacterium]
MLRKKGIWIGLIVLLLLAGVGYAYYRFAYLPDNAVVVEQIKKGQVLQGDIVVAVSGSGTLSPETQTSLGFEAGGYLDEILVEVGDVVQAGDVLARLETDDLQLAVANARIAL